MSSYYATYYGSALVLNEEEFETMVQKYKILIAKKLGKKKTEDFHLLMDESVQENSFIRAKYIKEDPNKILESEESLKIFSVVEVNVNSCDGMYLLPYKIHGEVKEFMNGYSLRQDNVYAIFSDKNLDSPQTLISMPYDSYEEFVQEFKDKLEAYLPEGFEWDEHIGSFSYACYA